jgi:hypothetical protein
MLLRLKTPLFYREKCNGIRSQSFLMAGGECAHQARYSRELISWEGMRNDEHSTMGALVIEKSNREPDEIIPVSGH